VEASSSDVNLVPLIKASQLGNDFANGNPKGDGVPNPWTLSKDEVIGNAFIFMFAGHETAANTMHFSLLLLAMNRPSQLHLQEDIDAIIGVKPSSKWTYANDMRNLYNSMVGAVQNEQLRLIPAVINIHKGTAPSPQTITIDGKPAIIPSNSSICLNVVGTQRNPKYYQHSPSKITDKTHDMDDFVPERWLLTSEEASKLAGMHESHEDDLKNGSYENEGLLFRPAKGSFIAFSEGARSCPGRRFAQVEITAVLAVIFQSYTVELDVGMFASDDEVRQMNFEEKRAVYAKARNRAERLIRESTYMITLKMRGDSVPVRFVKRGKEIFAGC
jgi:cytochrome P450